MPAVAPREWIEIEVPNVFPVRMQIGNGRTDFAFIDHRRHGKGFVTIAKRRCPAGLAPGTHPVRAILPDNRVVESEVEVAGTQQASTSNSPKTVVIRPSPSRTTR